MKASLMTYRKVLCFTQATLMVNTSNLPIEFAHFVTVSFRLLPPEVLHMFNQK